MKLESFNNSLLRVKYAHFAILIFFLLITFSFSIFSVFAQSEDINLQQGEIPQRLNSPDEVSKINEWKLYNFTGANFSILFPAKPGRHINSNSLPNEFTNQFRYYWDTSDEQLYFEAQVLEISSENSYDLNKGIQGFKRQMKSSKGILLNEQKLEVKGIQAVDFNYRIPDEPEPVLNYSRILFCNNRIYTLMVAGTKLQKDLAKVSSKYFNSFSPMIACEKQVLSNTRPKENKILLPATTITRRYIRGPKGGCYYINNQGKKEYVSRNLCK
jgi:hypothetical protein